MNKVTEREKKLIEISIHAEAVLIGLKLATDRTPQLATYLAPVASDLVRLNDGLDCLSDMDSQMIVDGKYQDHAQSNAIFAAFLTVGLFLLIVFGFFS